MKTNRNNIEEKPRNFLIIDMDAGAVVVEQKEDCAEDCAEKHEQVEGEEVEE